MAIDIGGGKQLFTLADAVGLAEGANQSEAKSIQAQEALRGNYILSDQQALQDIERKKTGQHLLDNGGTESQYLGLPIGKLPNHPAASNESPYSVKGFKGTEAGDWVQYGDNKWEYRPSQSQFDRNPNYMEGLANYFNKEKNNGVNRILLPNGKVIE